MNGPPGNDGEGRANGPRTMPTTELTTAATAIVPDDARVNAALAYQARGLQVVPLHGINPKTGVGCTCKLGADCRSTAKHPRDRAWAQAAPMTEAEIRDAWPTTGFRSTSNVGLATGAASGCFIIDIDPDKGGDEAWAKVLADQGAEEPATYTVRTGSGGQHLYFAMPQDFEVTNSPGALKAYGGIDVRGNGGQVVAPPSVTDKGGYSVVADVDIAPAPEWLTAMLRPKERPAAPTTTPTAAVDGGPRLTTYATKAWEGEVARLQAMLDAAVPEGQTYAGEAWNATTFEVACTLLELANADWTGYTQDDAYAAVLQHAPTDAGFTSEDVNARWQSAVKTVADKPRALPAERVSAAEIAAWDTPGEAAEKQADFWDERPVLAHVRDFAYARMCSPLAVLGVVLARVVAATPPQVVLPATIGSYASLNIFVGLVGDSGSGKGAAEAAAKDAVLLDQVEVATVGSGEGIGHLYAHREKGQVVRDRWAVLFTVPEVDVLTALGDRRGATLLPQLRSAWMGEQLGFAYADKNKALPIPEHTYRMGLVAGIQPGRAAGLLEDGDGGTPQRFVWLPATDPRIPERSAEPQPLRVRSQVWPSPDRGLFALAVPEVAQKAMRTARLARSRGEGDPLDGHALLCRLKVAAALTLLDGRRVVTDDDWRLAGVVMEVSARTRRGVQRHLAAQVSKANQARARFEGERAVIASETVEDAAVQRVARRLTTHLQEHGESARSDARKRLTSRDRPHFDEAVERLVAAGQAEVLTTPHGERLSLVGGSS